MAKVPKLIKAALRFSNTLPEQLLARGNAVLNGLTGNVNFANPPVDLSAFKTTLDAYSVSIGEATDGGKKAITLRNQLGGSVIRMLRVLASYVEFNCKDDMNIFLSSGFQPRSTTRTPAQPLEPPTILYVDQGTTGQLLVWIKPIRRARTYELRYGSVHAGGGSPDSWSTQMIAQARTAAVIDGITPGTTYAIQVRAYGPLGYTEWSHSATRMCI